MGVDAELERLTATHRNKRRAALERIAQAIQDGSSASTDATARDREYLETWRITLHNETQAVLAPHRTPKDTLGTPNFNDLPPTHIPLSPKTLSLAIHYHAATLGDMQSLSLTNLHLRHAAASHLATTPDMIGIMDELDEADVTAGIVAATSALAILRNHLRAADAESIISAILDEPRPSAPTLRRNTIDVDGEPIPEPADDTDNPTPPAQAAPTMLQWAHTTIDKIETKVRAYLEQHRWNSRGQHFGAVLDALNSVALPAILNDPDTVKYELTPDTAAQITILKNAQGVDHQDEEGNVVAWYEALVLWIEDHGKKEIPPNTVSELAKLYRVALLQTAPQPGTNG